MGLEQKIYSLIYKIIYRDKSARGGFDLYNRHGLKLVLSYANRVDRRLIIKKPYEPQAIKHFEDTIKTGSFDLMLDIGANIGLYSLIGAKAGCPRIIAFEPDSRNSYQLKANVLLNNFTDIIEVCPYGLSDEDARVGFLKEKGTNTGSSRVETTAPADTKYERYDRVFVPVCRFDDHFSFAGRRAFVKIDVEAHELNVIRGMANFLKRNVCILQIEVFDTNLALLEDYLHGIGYTKVREFDDDRIFTNSRSAGA